MNFLSSNQIVRVLNDFKRLAQRTSSTGFIAGFLFFFISPVLANSNLQSGNVYLDSQDIGGERTSHKKALQKSELVNFPGSVSIVSAEEIKKFGANDLLEVFDRMPGMQTFAASLTPKNIVAIRGQNFLENSSAILLLIDGKPYRDSGFGSYGPDLFLSFPLGLIKQIEVVRGSTPIGDGLGAYSGTINIVTYEPGEQANQVTMTAGPSNTHYISGAARILNSEDYSLVIGLKEMRSDGWKYLSYDRNNVFGSFSREEADLGLTLKGHYKKLHISSFLSTTDQTSIGVNREYEENSVGGEFNTRRRFLNLSYATKLKSDWRLGFNATYNHLKSNNIYDALAINADDSFDNFLLSVEAEGRLNDRADIQLGLSYEMNEGDISTMSESYNALMAYANLNYMMANDLRLYAGFNVHQPDDQDLEIYPRLGLIKTLSEDLTIKFSHGYSYRSPYLLERYMRGAEVAGNADLESEKMMTTDLQLVYREGDRSYTLNLYYSDLDDLVEPILPGQLGYPIGSVNSERPSFQNSAEHSFVGLELEFNYKLSRQVRVFANAHFKENEDGLNRDSAFTSDYMLKGGVIIEPRRRNYTMAFYNSYFSTPARTSEVLGARVLNFESEAYNLLSFKFAYRNAARPKGFKAAIYFENVLSNQVYYPDINNMLYNTIPLYPGARLYVTGTYRF